MRSLCRFQLRNARTQYPFQVRNALWIVPHVALEPSQDRTQRVEQIVIRMYRQVFLPARRILPLVVAQIRSPQSVAAKYV